MTVSSDDIDTVDETIARAIDMISDLWEKANGEQRLYLEAASKLLVRAGRNVFKVKDCG